MTMKSCLATGSNIQRAKWKLMHAGVEPGNRGKNKFASTKGQSDQVT